jgi:hypothetical protein
MKEIPADEGSITLLWLNGAEWFDAAAGGMRAQSVRDADARYLTSPPYCLRVAKAQPAQGQPALSTGHRALLTAGSCMHGQLARPPCVAAVHPPPSSQPRHTPASIKQHAPMGRADVHGAADGTDGVVAGALVYPTGG